MEGDVREMRRGLFMLLLLLFRCLSHLQPNATRGADDAHLLARVVEGWHGATG